MRTIIYNNYIRNIILIILLFFLLIIMLSFNNYLTLNKIHEGLIDRDDIRQKLYNDIYDYHDLSNNDLSNNLLLDWKIKNDYINNIPFISKINLDVNDFITAFQYNFSSLSPSLINNNSNVSPLRYNIGTDASNPILSQSDRIDKLYGSKIDDSDKIVKYDSAKLYTNNQEQQYELLKNTGINLSKKINNNEPCPVNMTPEQFKLKYNLTCYEICPPGQIYNDISKKCS